MATQARVRLYYHLRVLYQDLVRLCQTTSNVSEIHDWVMKRMSKGTLLRIAIFNPLLQEDTDAKEIEMRIRLTIRDIQEYLKPKQPAAEKPEKKQRSEEEKKRKEETAAKRIENERVAKSKLWEATIRECAKIATGYVPDDIIAAVDRILVLVENAKRLADPNVSLQGQLLKFVSQFALKFPEEKIPAESVDRRAIASVSKAIQVRFAQSTAPPLTVANVVNFVSFEYENVSDLVGDPTFAVIQNVCADCGRVASSPAYATGFVCKNLINAENTHFPGQDIEWINRCPALKSKRKAEEVQAIKSKRNGKKFVYTYLSDELVGITFKSPASFVEWAREKNNVKITRELYIQRVTPSELCFLSTRGYLRTFQAFWNTKNALGVQMLEETKIATLNPSLRGHHINAFPDVIGDSTVMEYSESGPADLISFLQLRVDVTTREFINSTRPALRREVVRDVNVFVSSSSSSSSAQEASAPEEVPAAGGSGPKQEPEEDEEMIIVTQFSPPSAPETLDPVVRARRYAELAQLAETQQQRWSKRQSKMVIDEDDEKGETSDIPVPRPPPKATTKSTTQVDADEKDEKDEEDEEDDDSESSSSDGSSRDSQILSEVESEDEISMEVDENNAAEELIKEIPLELTYEEEVAAAIQEDQDFRSRKKIAAYERELVTINTMSDNSKRKYDLKRQIQEEKAALEAEEQEAVAMVGSGEIRGTWGFTFYDMKNALNYLIRTANVGSGIITDEFKTQMKRLALLIVYQVLPPTQDTADVVVDGTGEVQVLPKLRGGALDQHGRLFESQIVDPLRRDPNAPVPFVRKMAARLMSMVASGVDSDDTGESKTLYTNHLLTAADYIARVRLKTTPWARLRQGNLSDFPKTLASSVSEKKAVADEMIPGMGYATGLFAVTNLDKLSKDKKKMDYSDISVAIFGAHSGYAEVEGIGGNGILPMYNDDKAWDQFASDRDRLASLSLVLAKVFGSSKSIFLSRSDWSAIIHQTERLIMEASPRSASFEYYVENKSKTEKGRKMAEKYLRRIETAGRLADNLIEWVAGLIPRDTRVLKAIQWKRFADPTINEALKDVLVVRDLGSANPDDDEEEEEDGGNDHLDRLFEMEDEIKAAMRKQRESERSLHGTVTKQIFGDANVDVDLVVNYINKWAEVREVVPVNPLSPGEQAARDTELRRFQMDAFPRIFAEERKLVEKSRPLVTKLGAVVPGGASEVLASIMYATPGAARNFVQQLENLTEADKKIADSLVDIRVRLEETRAEIRRTESLAEWATVTRRLDFGEYVDEDLDKSILEDRQQQCAMQVFPEVRELLELDIALQFLLQDHKGDNDPKTLKPTRELLTSGISDSELKRIIDDPNTAETLDVNLLTTAYTMRRDIAARRKAYNQAKDFMRRFILSEDATLHRREVTQGVVVSVLTQRLQRFLFVLGFTWPNRGMEPTVVSDPKLRAIIQEINAEYIETSAQRRIDIMDHYAAEQLWLTTPSDQLRPGAKGLDYSVNVTKHRQNFLDDIPRVYQSGVHRTDIRRIYCLFVNCVKLGYPWQADDLRFVLQLPDYGNNDESFRCIVYLWETCRKVDNTRLRRILIEDVLSRLDEDSWRKVYRDSRRVHARMSKTTLERIPLSEREIRVLVEHCWHLLGPDELANFPSLDEDQVNFAVSKGLGTLFAAGNMAAKGIHKLYVFHRLAPPIKPVFESEAKSDPAYLFIKQQGKNLALTSINDGFATFKQPAAPATEEKQQPPKTKGSSGPHLITKIAPGGPFYVGATNFATPTYCIGAVVIPTEVAEALKQA